MLSKVKGRWGSLLTFQLNIKSWAFSIESGLKLIFYWCPRLLILAKPLQSSAAELSTWCTTKTNEVSSANNLTLDNNSSARSFICIKNTNSPSIELCRTPVLTLVHVETCSFKTTLCFPFLKKLHYKFKSSPDMPFCFNLKITPPCYELLIEVKSSNTFINLLNSLTLFMFLKLLTFSFSTFVFWLV